MKTLFALGLFALLGLNACTKSVASGEPPASPVVDAPKHECGCKFDLTQEKEQPSSLCEKGSFQRGYFIRGNQYVFVCVTPKHSCHCKAE